MKLIQQALQRQFDKMCATGMLFRSRIPGGDVWGMYLKSFSPSQDPTFRDPQSSTHNCNNCKNFIRRYGNVVAIVDGQLTSMFTPDVHEEYYKSFKAIHELLLTNPIQSVFFETFAELNSLPYESCTKQQEKFKLGIAENHKQYNSEEVAKFGQVNEKDVYKFEHMMVTLPKRFVDMTGRSVEAIVGEYRDKYSVFKRAVAELPIDTLMLVKDLINQNSLLNGTSYLPDLITMIDILQEYGTGKNDDWFWTKTYSMPERVAKFKNTLMGVLCTELAQGEEINRACLNWNKRADPVNYMKASAPITRKQIEEAEKLVAEQGYSESFHRRFASIDDINADEILHSNVGDGKIKSVGLFDKVKATAPTRHKRSQFDAIEEVPIDKFMKDILPTCTSVELFVENRLESNLVALTTAEDPKAKNIFKWDNPFSWTFNGNLAGKSEITEAVKSAGGKTDGVLRFSIIWNEDGKDILDYDAHCIQPSKESHIYYGNKGPHMSSGSLDVDMISPKHMGVENIVFTNKSKMKDGDYTMYIQNFNGGMSKGFKAEIVMDGVTYTYNHKVHVPRDQRVAVINLTKGVFTITHHLPCEEESKTVWNLETNSFHKVNLACLTPNHWGKNNVGNKHYMFMLEGCKVSTPMRSFHTENLNQDLAKIRKVTEILANTTMVNPTPKQLCGVAFNSTVKDEVILKLGGNFKRTVKVKF